MEGNQLFQEKKMEEAFRAYNMSVLRARNDGTENFGYYGSIED